MKEGIAVVGNTSCSHRFHDARYKSNVSTPVSSAEEGTIQVAKVQERTKIEE